MLPAEPAVLAGREDFNDAQSMMAGVPTTLGFFTLGWYGTDTSDETGCFALVDPVGPLAAYVGNVLRFTYGKRSVNAYVIGSLTGLGTNVAVTRRVYAAISLLAVDPIIATVAVVQ